MNIDKAQLEKIAHLARLTLQDEKTPALLKDMSNILTLVEQMNEVDTTTIEPMAHPLDIAQPIREDRITENDKRDFLQQNAPAVEHGLYLVPKVIE